MSIVGLCSDRIARNIPRGRDYLSSRQWPWWESIASCVAFTAWSAALPQTAF